MRFDALEAFGTFADHLNFTRAAAELHISQPALHTKIQKLAEDLELTLYRKEGRQLRLTADGERLATFAREIANRTADFEAEIFGASPSPLTFAAGRGAYLHLMGDAVRRYLRKFGALNLMTLRGPEVLAAVSAGRVQLGIVTRLPADDRAFESRRLRVVHQVVVMPKTHSLASRKMLRPIELRDEALVVPPTGRPHRNQITTVMAQAKCPWQVAVEADGWDLMVHFVAQRIGLSIINDNVPLPRGLCRVPIRGFPEIVYRLVWKRTMNSPRISFLVEQISRAQTEA